MAYEPTTWKPGDKITSAKLNNIEQGIAAFYPQTQIIAPEQTVTITSEDTLPGVIITLADGYTLPEELPNNWSVVVNGKTLRRSPIGNNYSLDLDTLLYGVSLINGALYFFCSGEKPNQSIPGDYTVKITEAAQESGGILFVKNNNGVLDKTAAEIWNAMRTGLVLVETGDDDVFYFDLIYNASHLSDYTFTTTPGNRSYSATNATDYPEYAESPK